MEYERPTGDFVETSLSGAITATATTGTIGTGLDLPATNGVLHIDYDSTTAVGSDNGPETVSYATYTTGTGALTGLTRGLANTDNGTPGEGVAHANGASVHSALSVVYFGAGMIKNDDLETTAGEPGGAWKSWTPTWTGLTVGAGGTVEAKYTQIGKTVHFRLKFTFGTGSSVGDTSFTLPVTSVTYGLWSSIGSAKFRDNSRSQVYKGDCNWLTTTTAQIAVLTANATGVILNGLTANLPFTAADAWAANDSILVVGTYEAA